MNTEPLFSKEIHYTERLQQEHECKEEYRQHDYMQQLRDKPSENRRNLSHFCHYFDVTKLRIIFFNPK